MLLGCGRFITVNPNTNETVYEDLGRDIGIYMLADKPELANNEKVNNWIKVVLSMTDAEIVNTNALDTMYKWLLKEYPERPELILLAKSALRVAGVEINLKGIDLTADEMPVYVRCTKGLLKGYSEVVN
jgi:hypothetical protein